MKVRVIGANGFVGREVLQRLNVISGLQALGIAIQWARTLSLTEQLRRTELLRQQLRLALDLDEDKIDLIDVSGAGLTMRALVAEQGKELVVQDDLAWIRFLSATWFELEDHYWRAQHAA